MAPTIFGENKKQPRLRSEQFKHTRPRTNTTARLSDSFSNSSTIETSLNYGILLKRYLVAIIKEQENVIKFPKEDWRSNPSTKTTSVTDKIPLEEMDADDEEVRFIISSQKNPKTTECLDRPNDYERAPKEPNLQYLNSHNNSNNSSILTNTNPIAVLNNNVNHFTTVSISNEFKNDLRIYAGMCEEKNAEGLLEIAIKTIKLIKRNQLLQRRLAQLQMETKEFIASVLANPENRCFRNKPPK